MKRLIIFFNGLYLFSLSLWVAGMFLLGILTEIVVRIKLKDHKLLASDIMNGIMDAFNVHIIYWCMGLMVTAAVIQFLANKNGWAGYSEPVVAKKKYTKQVLLAVMVVVALYIGSVLRPQMHDLDQQKKANPADIRLQTQFDSYHSRLTWFYTVNMISGLWLFFIHGREMARFKESSGDPGAE